MNRNKIILVGLLITLMLSSSAIALTVTKEPVAMGGDERVPGFIGEDETSLRVELSLESTTPITAENIYFDSDPQTQFTSCTSSATSTSYTCHYTTPFDPSEYTSTIQLVPIVIDNPEGRDVRYEAPKLRKDRTDPQITAFSHVGAASSGVSFMLGASDDEGGIKSVKVFKDNPSSGPIMFQKTLDKEDDGAYPSDYQAQEVLTRLDDGVNKLWLVAEDAFGNTRTSSMFSIRVDDTAPVITGWQISDCASYSIEEIEENAVQLMHVDGREVCIYLMLDGEVPSNEWNITAEAVRFDRDNTQRADATYVSDDFSCVPDGQGSFCRLSTYRDGTPISLSSDRAVTQNFAVRLSVIDDWGNEASDAGTQQVLFVDSVPQIRSFGTTAEYDGTFYATGDEARIRLSFVDSPASIEPEDVRIDAGDIGGGSLEAAQSCDESSCTWVIEDPASGTVELVQFEDTFGNTLNLETVETEDVRFDLVVDDTLPLLISAKLTNTEVAGSWSKECELNDAGDGYHSSSMCAQCAPEDGNAAGCTIDFWDYRTTYFELDKYLDIEISVVKDSAYLEVVMDTTGIVGPENGRNVTLELDEGDSTDELLIFTKDSIGEIADPGTYFMLYLTDAAGNVRTVKLPFRAYGKADSVSDIWDVAHETEYQSPAQVNREWASLTPMVQTNIFTFTEKNPQSDYEIIYVKPDCEVLTEGFEDVVDSEDINGFWQSNNYILSLPLHGSGEGNFSSISNLNVNCSFETATVVNDDEVIIDFSWDTLNVSFYDVPYGTPSEELKDEIRTVKNQWRYYHNWISYTYRTLDVLKNVCRVMYDLSSLTAALAYTADMLPQGAFRESIMTVLQPTTGFFKNAIFGNIGGFICDSVNCDWCDGGVGPSGQAGSEGDPIPLFSEDAMSDYLADTDGAFNKGDKQNFCHAKGGLVEAYRSADAALNDWWRNLGLERIDKVGEFMKAELGVPSVTQTSDSLLLSMWTLCPTDILANIEKNRQTDCRYIKCLESTVDTPTTIDDCKLARGYEKCTYVAGELWAIMPGKVLNDITKLFERLITDPYTMFGMGMQFGCSALCRWGPQLSCTVCHTAENLGPLLEKYVRVADEIKTAFTDWDSYFDSISGGKDFCDGIDFDEDDE